MGRTAPCAPGDRPHIADAAATAGVPTYAYQFAWSAPRFGADHCSDLPFVFDHQDAPGAVNLLERTHQQS